MSVKNEFIEFAEYLADVSGEISRKYFRKDFNGELEKDDNSPVTIADVEIEEFMREELKARFPEHGIYGEEYGDLQGNSQYKWFIDPIDGTTSFITGQPTFTNLIALTYQNTPIIGIVNQPINNERWVAVEAETATLNKQPIHTRRCSKMTNAILSTTSPNLFNKQELTKFNIVASKTKYQKYGGAFFGGDSYAYGLLASGYIDIIIEANLKPYDFMPLVLLVKAAGGAITDWQGAELNENSKGQIIACGDKAMHQEVIALLNESFH